MLSFFKLAKVTCAALAHAVPVALSSSSPCRAGYVKRLKRKAACDDVAYSKFQRGSSLISRKLTETQAVADIKAFTRLITVSYENFVL